MTSEGRAQRRWKAGEVLWRAFIGNGGRLTVNEAREVARAAGYMDGRVFSSHVAIGYLRREGDDYVFTDKAWQDLGDIYGRGRGDRARA